MSTESKSRYSRWLFPPLINLPQETTLLLKNLYPTIDWSLVKFHDGIPWFSPYSITLPDAFDRQIIHIYLKRYRPRNISSLTIIVHEAFHVQQYHDLNLRGFGFYRSFMSHYLGLWMRYGYRKHPMEIPAYRTDSLFKAQYQAYASSGLQLEDIPWSAPFPIRHSGIKKNPYSIFYFLGACLTLLITPILPLSYVLLGIPHLLFNIRSRF